MTLTAIIGDIELHDDHAVIHRDGCIIVDTGHADADAASAVADSIAWDEGVGGWIIPDLSTLKIIYR
jgi:hypothetical protein